MDQANPKQRRAAASMAALLTMAAFGALAASLLAAPAGAHPCSGTFRADCGGCSSGVHSHSWFLPVPGGCTSYCSDPNGCDPGTATKLTASLRNLSGDVSDGPGLSRQLSPCDPDGTFNYVDGGWFAVAHQGGRSYSTFTTGTLVASASFYSASGSGCDLLTVTTPGKVPDGTDYVLLDAGRGEGTATFLSFA